MSITSAIGLERLDGTVDAIYCDNDSYLAGVGLTLADDYTTLEKVAQLMDLGNLSRLGSIATSVAGRGLAVSTAR